MPARGRLRIANCSGFYGDRVAAAREVVEGGPIDVLTGDYLAELTMLILWKNRQRDPDAGYATTFLTQMEEVLGTCLDRGIRIVTNAGGLNPAGLATRLRRLSDELGLRPRIAHIEGDDLISRIPDLQASGVDLAHLDTGETLAAAQVNVITANAYLGAWGIVEALRAGADVVVCPRVTDASLVVGPAAWAFEWARDDWDRLAGAVVAGHILECGAQATGGNFAFFTEIPQPVRAGMPIAEMSPDGSCVITKHPGTGGRVSVDTVTAQLLYEIDEPRYLNPDVIARFDSIRLQQEGVDRVSVTHTRGEPAPPTLKVCINHFGGYKNSVSFMLTGLDVEAKARFVEAGLFDELGGRAQFADSDVRLTRSDHRDAARNPEAVARLTITVRDADPAKVGRRFFDAVIGLGLSSYPGMFAEGIERRARAYGVYWPALLPASCVSPEVVLDDGRRIRVTGSVVDGARLAADADSAGERAPATRWGREPTRTAPLGMVVGARSGDKGGNANVGLWARSDGAFDWLSWYLTVERLRELMPEAAALVIRRHLLPNLRALNFVVAGLLQEGVAASTRPDPQAKGLGEFLRSRFAEIPISLLDGGGDPPAAASVEPP